MTAIFEEDIKKCVEIMRKGGIILYPTDTIWGIGCDATNADAVKRVYDLKQRTDSKAMLVLVDNEARLDRYVTDVPEVAYQLVEVADKPLTVIYDGAKNLAPNLVGSDGSIGIRVTREAFSRELCRRFGRPVVSTSANVSGAASARNFDEISDEIKNGVDYIVDFRRNDKTPHKASSIIKLKSDGTVTILRQ